MGLSKAVVKNRVLILMIALILLVPAVFGMLGTRINYDMLDYLPSDMDTVIGQETLKEDFGKGAFSFIVVQDMPVQEVAQLKEKIQQVDHVESVLWYDSVADLSIPMELLPDKLYNEFNTDDATMLAVFFDSATSEDVTMDAIREIRSIAGKQCFVSGMSALVTDLKDLCEQEEPIYVALAVACACAAMMLLLDGWLVPFVFLASIGMAIVYNLGSNFFLGEISYITKALSAVLQLAVTMDYSIFLWHSYNEQLTLQSDHKEAMAVAIHNTFTSVIGSSATTIAGFIALCFMSFTLGRDLGIVMAKGVLLGVLGCVTILPSLILVLDKPLQRTRHKSLIPDMGGFAKGVCKIFPVFLVIFALLVAPAYISYDKTNDEVYYDMGQCLPEDMEYVIANKKLSEEFDIASTHMLLVNADLPDSDVRAMIDEMEQVPGVKYVLGMESVVGPMIPMEVLPDSVRSMLESDQWELLLINSEYKVASDDVNQQIDQLNAILKKYDEGGMLIGEAPCMKDMIETTDHDFKVVNAISIAAIFIIITLVELLPALHPDRRHRAGYLHQSGPAPCAGSVAAFHRPHLYQYHPAGRYGGLRHPDDHPLQGGAAQWRGQEEGRHDRPADLGPFHHRQRHGPVRRHLRRGAVFQHRYRGLHVYADGPWRYHQRAAGAAGAVGSADPVRRHRVPHHPWYDPSHW